MRQIGVSTDGHPIRREIDRVKEYMMRIKQLESSELSKIAASQANDSAAENFVKQTLLSSNGDIVDTHMEDTIPHSVPAQTLDMQSAQRHSSMIKRIETKLGSSGRSLPQTDSMIVQFEKLKKGKSK